MDLTRRDALKLGLGGLISDVSSSIALDVSSSRPKDSEEWFEQWLEKNNYQSVEDLEKLITESIPLFNNNARVIRQRAFDKLLDPYKSLVAFHNPFPRKIFEIISRYSPENVKKSSLSGEQKFRLKNFYEAVKQMQNENPTRYPYVKNSVYEIIKDLNKNFGMDIRIDLPLHLLERELFIGRNELSSVCFDIQKIADAQLLFDDFKRYTLHLKKSSGQKFYAEDYFFAVITEGNKNTIINLHLDPNIGKLLHIESSKKHYQIEDKVEVHIPALLPEWEYTEKWVYATGPCALKLPSQDFSFSLGKNEIQTRIIAAVNPINSILPYDRLPIGVLGTLLSRIEKKDTWNVTIQSTPFADLFEKTRHEKEFMITRACADASAFYFYDENNQLLENERKNTIICGRDIIWEFEMKKEPSYFGIRTYKKLQKLELSVQI